MDKQSIEGRGVIHIYTREQAIEDGQLIDASETPEAKEAGFRIPVCLTVGVHALVQVPELLSDWQDYSGRLWDTLFLAAAAFKRAGEKHLVPFDVIYQADPRRSATVTLWLCFSENEAVRIEKSPFGNRYIVEGIMEAPDGRRPLVRSVWFIEDGDRTPRFVTAYPLQERMK